LYYISIDIAKNNHEESIIDENGSLLSESISFPNSQSACEKLFKLLTKFGVTKDNCVIGLEAIGHYWLALYSYLINFGFI
jgi:transposase